MIGKIARTGYQLFFILVGWLLVVPLARLIPKKSGLVLFVGQADGRFADNVKYLYLHAHENALGSIEPFFAMNSRKYRREFDELTGLGYRVVCTRSLKGVWTMVRTRLAIFDHETWTRTWQVFLFAGANKVQLWHGSGIKRIRRMPGRKKSTIEKQVYELLTTPLVHYDSVLMNSDEQLRTRRAAFLAESYYVGVHPRVDALFQPMGPGAQVGTDIPVLSQVKQFKQQGSRVVLYAPTFRRRLPAAESVIDYDTIARWAADNDIIWVQKSHPNSQGRLKSDSPRVIEYDRSADVYPLLKHVDVLVTDYSSIYTDFLLTDRPICFFTHDLLSYIEHERTLFIDYEGALPGVRVENLEELLAAVCDVLVTEEKDPFQTVRATARATHFAPYCGDGAKRLWAMVQEKYLVDR